MVMGQAMIKAVLLLPDGREGVFWLTPEQVDQGRQGVSINIEETVPQGWIEEACPGKLLHTAGW